MIDTHAHLQDKMFENVDEIINSAKESGVSKIVCASSDENSSLNAVELANRYECVFATVGVHPEEANSFNEQTISVLEHLAQNKKVVAIGEIGLDYCHEFATREKQKEVFLKQIDLAQKLKLPVVIHSRDATGDTLEILKQNAHKLTNGVCIHCFSMSTEILKEITKMGFYISLGGIVTFKNANNVLNVAKECDINLLMLETDCPYLAPVPFRSKINQPKYVVKTLEKIAEIRGLEVKELEEITTKNAERFYKI